MSQLRRTYYFVFIAAVAMLAVAMPDEENFSVEGSEVRVSAESGVMEFRRHRRAMSNETGEIRSVVIKMAQVVQLDSKGKEVMNCSIPESNLNKPKTADSKTTGMRFSNFAGTNFTIDQTKKHQLLRNSGNKLKALTKKFHANLGDDVGKVEIDMALPEIDGEIDIDGEKQKLKKGDLKFNIELSEWTWCGEDGDDGAAAFLDVYIEVNSTQLPKKRHSRTPSSPASFDLGDNTTMSFSGKFRRENSWENVHTDYPKLSKEYPNCIIVRFMRFNSSLLYDPTVSVEGEAEANANNKDKSNGDASDCSCLSTSAMFITMATTVTYILLK